MVRNLSPVRTLAALFFLVVCGLALTSCGGGGGTNSGSTGSLQFTANVSSVTFNYVQGATPPPQVVTITATGNYTGTLYVAAEATGEGIATTIPIAINGYTATAQISPAAGLAAGSYSGQVQLLACSDPTCTQQIGNSPLTIAYTITVDTPPPVTPPPPSLQVSPSPLAVTVVSGTVPTQVVTVQLPQGQTTFSTAVESGIPWLTVTAATATSFTISLASLPSGSYNGAIEVSSGGSVLTLNVNYTVTPPTGGDQSLAANPTSLTLATVEDATTSATLGVTPPSWNAQVTATVEYPTGGASGWLTLTPAAGGQQVVASAANLKAGSYTANIRLHGAYPGTDVLVPVALTVGVGLVRPADVSVTVNAETTAAALSGSVPVNVVSGPSTGWSATSNAPWLVLTQGSGQTGGSLTYTIDPSQLGTLPNAATSTAAVTITPTLTSMTPVAFNVSLALNLPQVTTLAPYVQLSGEPARVILRGSGFSAIATPSARVTLSPGITTNSVTVVNDTEMVAQFSALAAGSYTVAVSNALSVATATGNVVAVNAQTYAYTAIPLSGALTSLAYDPERSSLYAANTTTESVMSFHFSGSAWQTTSALFAAAFDVGLKQDGSGLLATSNGGASGSVVELLNPTSLATVQSANLPSNIGVYVGLGIPATNDGRSWLSIGLGPPTTGEEWNNMAYLPPGSLTPTIVTPPNVAGGEFFNGPWYAQSRDGERLIIVQTDGESPAPPMLYMNAADSLIRTNPAGLTASLWMSVDERGDRVLFDTGTVRDGAFNLIGATTLPTVSGQPDYYAMDGVITPDGTRAYVLAYRSDASYDTVAPRVFVFDATTAQANLNVLGYFDVADYPGCVPPVNNSLACPNDRVVGAISLDGQTLFFAGNQNLLVVPVPATLSIVSTVRRTQAAQKQGRLTTTPWPLNIH